MKRILLVLMALSVAVFASELSNLMARYKQAPESQKYKIMNQIKLEIAKLNKSRQRAAIFKLHHVLESSISTHSKSKNNRPNPLDILGGEEYTVKGTPESHTPSPHSTSGSHSGSGSAGEDRSGSDHSVGGSSSGGSSGSNSGGGRHNGGHP